MRVVYVIDSLVTGGAERSLASLTPHLVDGGVNLHVAYLRDRPGLHKELEAGGARLSCLDGPGGRVGRVQRLHRLVTGYRPDLIHTTLFEANLTGRLVGRITRVPVVTSLVNLSYGPEQYSDPRYAAWKLRVLKRLDSATGRSVVRWHAIARYVADVMSERLRIPRRDIDVVPRGRDPENLGRRTEARTALTRKDLGITLDQPLVLAAARQEYQKGLDLLLEAFALVHRGDAKARLVLAGQEGSQSRVLRETIARLRLDQVVDLVGVRSDLADLMCAADAFVFPSRWEGFGGVVLEAMALEAPIVASRLPVLEGVLEHGNTARLIPAGDVPALASALAETLKDRVGAANMAQHARSHFLQNFTVDRAADGMIDFYQRALGERAESFRDERRAQKARSG